MSIITQISGKKVLQPGKNGYVIETETVCDQMYVVKSYICFFLDF